MQPSWTITNISVSLLFAVGTGLMFGPTEVTHWVGCIAFLLAAILMGVTGVMWFWKQPDRDLATWMKAAGIAAFTLILCPAMIYFAWPVNAQVPQGGVRGNCNNFGNNNFNCNVINPGRTEFSQEIGDQLLVHMTEKKPVELRTVGNALNQAVGDQIQQFLGAHGFMVNRAHIGVIVPPPDQPFTFMDSTNSYIITVAPSAH